LARRLADVERQIAELRHDNEVLDSTLKVREEEVRLLTALNARNQERINAETAEYARRVALVEVAQEDRKRLVGGYGT
jgi:hypothetical protein